jgi:hypothetical protein
MIGMFGSLIELAYELKTIKEFDLYLNEVALLQDKLTGDDYKSLLHLSPSFQHYYEWVIIKNIMVQNINNSKLPQFIKNSFENALKYDRWTNLIVSAKAASSLIEKLFTSILSVQPSYAISFLSPKAVRLAGNVQAVLHRSGLVKILAENFSKERIPQEVKKLEIDLNEKGFFFLGDKGARKFINDFIKNKPEFRIAVTAIVFLNAVQSIFKQLIHDLMIDRTLFLPNIEKLKKRFLTNSGWGFFYAESTNPILVNDYLFILLGGKTSPDSLLLFDKKIITFDPVFGIKIKGYIFNSSFLFSNEIW